MNANCVIGTALQTDVSSSAVHVEYQCNNVGPDYFALSRFQCCAGASSAASPPVVNETFGRAVFGHMDPAGHTIKPDFPDAKEQLIVGVVKDSKYFTLGEKQRLAAYEPYFISEELPICNS